MYSNNSVILRFDQLTNTTRNLSIDIDLTNSPYMLLQKLVEPLGIITDLLSEVVPGQDIKQIDHSLDPQPIRLIYGLLGGWWMTHYKRKCTEHHARIDYEFRRDLNQKAPDWNLCLHIGDGLQESTASSSAHLFATSCDPFKYLPGVVVYHLVLQWMLISQSTAILKLS